MSVSITVGDLQALLGILSDGTAAYAADFADKQANEVVVFDVIRLGEKMAEPLAEAALGSVAPIIGPLVVEALIWAIQNNRSAEAGSLTREGSGNKGSNPWRTGG